MTTIEVLWCDLAPHVNLQEYVRVDGLDSRDEAFWLILLPTSLHNIHLVAYSYAGIAARAPAGALGVVALKPGAWAHLTLAKPRHAPVHVVCERLDAEPDGEAFPAQAVGFGNIVDYVHGNALRVQAHAKELESRFIKQWDIPVAYAFASGRASSATHGDTADHALQASEAEVAKFSRLSDMASVAVEAQIAQASDGAKSAWAEATELAETGAPARLRMGKVHVLGAEESSAMEFRVEHPVCIRVFDAGAQAPDSEQHEKLAQQLRRESLMHMRLRLAEPAQGQSARRLVVVYQDSVAHQPRAEDLGERNVIGTVRLDDGRGADAVRVSEVGATSDAHAMRVVRVTNLAPATGLRVAVWVADPLTPALSVGGQLGAGRYRLVRCVGAGGMGVVWLAHDLRLGEDVALKFLPPEIRTDPVALDDLRSEALRCHRLSHPHIVRIHDLVEAPGEPAFVSMEYVDGPTLTQSRLARPQRVLPWESLAPLTRELGSALEYAHGEHIIHRDLKPANVMLDPRGRVKLTDFGIAASLSESFSTATYGRRIRGTPAYMSPQQLEGGRPCPADDIYALGATLYEILTSRPPFFSGDVIYQVLSIPPVPVAQRLAELGLDHPVPDPVAATILACLAKEPEQRPLTVRHALECMGLGLHPAAGAPEGVGPSPPPPPTAGAPHSKARVAGWFRRAVASGKRVMGLARRAPERQSTSAR